MKPSTSRNFRLSAIFFALFVMLTAVAMALYPGGTILDPKTEGYRLSENFFSDLGRRHAPDGRSNLPSMILFITAMGFSALGGVIFFVNAPRLCPQNRQWARAASFFGVISALSYLAIGAYPIDLYEQTHLLFVQIAFSASFFAATLYYIAMARNPIWPRRYPLLLLLMSLCLGGYVLIIFRGPSLDHLSGLIFHAIAQKIIVYLLTMGLGLLAYGGMRQTGHPGFYSKIEERRKESLCTP
jgi:hypothetical membrane protein